MTISNPTVNDEPLDVWLRIPPGEEESEAEANTYHDPMWDRYVVEWYLTSVGLVKSVWFDRYVDAETWLTQQGFEDYSS